MKCQSPAHSFATVFLRKKKGRHLLHSADSHWLLNFEGKTSGLLLAQRLVNKNVMEKRKNMLIEKTWVANFHGIKSQKSDAKIA